MQNHQKNLVHPRKRNFNRPVICIESGDDYDLWQRNRTMMAKLCVCIHEGADRACHHKRAVPGQQCECCQGMVLTSKCTGYRSWMFPNGR
jgi:hypothetical protein